MIDNKGEPAFPCFEFKEGDGQMMSVGGVILRDYLAARAMASLITEADEDIRAWLDDHGEGISSVKALALASYYIADVMLAERAK